MPGVVVVLIVTAIACLGIPLFGLSANGVQVEPYAAATSVVEGEGVPVLVLTRQTTYIRRCRVPHPKPQTSHWYEFLETMLATRASFPCCRSVAVAEH